MVSRMEMRNRPNGLLRVEVGPFHQPLDDPIATENAGIEDFKPADAEDDNNDGPSKAKRKNAKTTADVKWTDSMEKNLIHAV